MANPFGDELSPSSASNEFGENPFGDEPKKRDGYVGASAKAGFNNMESAIGTAIDALNPFTTSEADLAILYKNDPNAAADRAKIAPQNSILRDLAKQSSARSKEVMSPENLTPEAQATAKKEYATTESPAWLDPSRVTGDVLQSAPSSAILAGTMLATRGAGKTAFAQAKAAGMTDAAATAVAARAAGNTMAKVGAASESALGGVQGYQETLGQAEEMTDEQWSRSPVFRDLMNRGYPKEAAKTLAGSMAATQAGTGAGIADAAINAVGGKLLGGVMGSGKGVGTRVAASGLEGAVTETAQSPAEKRSGNQATKTFLNPEQKLDEGLLEAAVAGGVVGTASSVPMGVLGGSKHSDTGRKMLDGAATALEMEEATGFAPEAARTVENISGQAAKKPKLNGVQSRVAIAAQAAGVSPATALAVMQLESGGRDASNPNSSAKGLFQIIDSTWAELGGGDRADEATQIKNGVAYLGKISASIRATVGQDPTPAEVYMGHMLGPAGVKQLMMANQNLPDEPFINTVRKWDSKNADAIVNNNRFTGMTNKQVYDRIADKVARETQRLGLDTEMNRIVKVSPTSDIVPDALSQEEDTLQQDLDAMLQEDELSPMTPDEDFQAEIEGARLPGQIEELNEEHRQLDEANPVEEALEEDAKLPLDLASAKPKYGAPMGKGNYDIEFDNDVDKAAYIVANGASRSPRDNDYLSFVMQATGMTEQETRDYGAELKKLARERLNAIKDPDSRVINLSTTRSALPDSFVSFDEAKTRKAYSNPNNRVAISKTPIAAARDESAVGETLATRKLQTGEVVALSFDGAHAPQPYVAAMQQTVQGWMDRFMPQSAMLLTFRTLDPTKVASWKGFNKRTSNLISKRNEGGAYIHQLNLRNATNLGNDSGSGSSNPSVQRKIAYSMAHEFGHALAEEQFKVGMPPEVAAKFDNLGLEEYFTEQDLASLPPDTASVLREYNDLKRRVLTDPSMTGREFINAWLSPWKTAHGWDGKKTAQGAESFAALYLGQSAALSIDKYTASQMARIVDAQSNVLSPEEYMAEQFSRYAYSRSLFKNSPLDTQAFFGRVFEALSKFFRSIKNQGIAESGTQFAAWVDGLTTAGKNVPNPALPKADNRKTSAKPRVKTRPAVSTPVPREGTAEVLAAAAKSEPSQTVRKNIGGRDYTLARSADGDWFEVDAAGMMSGGTLGRTEQIATGVLARRERLREAGERNNKASRSGYQAQKPLAPSIVPPVQEDTVSEAAGENWSSESQLEAELFLRTDPTLKLLRTDQPELFAELRELVKAHKLDEFKWETRQYVSDEVADKMAFDTDNPEHTQMLELGDRLQEALPNSGLKRFFKEGMRRLANHKYYTMTMTQIAYANPWNAGLQHVNNMMNEFKTFKARLEFRAVENADAWSKLGKEQRGLLEKAMRAEHYRGEHLFELRQINKTWRFVPTQATIDYAAKNKLDEGTVKIWMDVKNSYVQHMNVLQSTMAAKLKERLSDRPALLKKRYLELSAMFEGIRATPFMPQTRFGEYAIEVVDSQVEGNKIVHVEFFENSEDRDRAKAELKKVLKPGQTIQNSMYSPSSAILRSLPPEILTFYSQEMNLTPEQKAEMRKIADVVTRNRQTRKYSAQLAMISGANKDMLQNYADFMAHDSNNIAKLHYRSRLNDGINQMRKDQQALKGEGDTAAFDEMRDLIKFAENYKNHMLDPAQEFHMLRSFVVLKMLWGNIKTAAANLNSLWNLYSVAMAQQGNLRGAAEVTGMELKVLNQSLQNLGKRVLRQPVEGGSVFDRNERWALDKAKVDGLLDETFAAQLAQFSGASTLDRMRLGPVRTKFDQVVKFGMMPQHAVENYTRRVTLLQQFNTYMKRPEFQDMPEQERQKQAYALAQNDLHLMQGNNTQANRPSFMRGKKSLFFIFYGYMQNMLYLMSGAQERSRNQREAMRLDPTLTIEDSKKHRRIRANGETLKLWMGYAAMGGLMGLPGAEDADKLLGLIARKMFGSDFSLKEYSYELGNYISQNAAKIGMDVNPRSIVHGGMSEIDLFGLTPTVDMSSSMSLGNALPGMGSADQLDKRGGAGEFLLGALGPFGSVIKDVGKAFSDDPSMMNRMGLVMPNTAKAWVKAVQEHRHGVMYQSGGKVTFDRETQELRDLSTGETLMRFAGFSPSIVTANKELHWMQKDKADYWTARRTQLSAQMWEARKIGDREAEADVREAVAEFNEQADPALRLTYKDINVSMKKRERQKRLDEQRTSAAKRFRGMYKEMEEDFMGASPED